MKNCRSIWFCRLLLPLMIGGALVLGSPWDRIQMESLFGRPPAPEEVGPPAFWNSASAPLPTSAPGAPPLRVLSYNLHSGLGGQWRLFVRRQEVEDNLRAIARHIVAAAPDGAPVDVVGLNEVDFHSRRSGWIDQARFLADQLQFLTGHHYRVIRGETWRRDLPGLEVRFGNALLTRHPVLESSALDLPRPGSGMAGFLGERRGVVRARIAVHERPLTVLVTHLEAFVLRQRETQAAQILRQVVKSGEPTLLLGDINAVPAAMTVSRAPFAADRTHDILTSGALLDARVGLAAARGEADLGRFATYPAAAPRWPLDGIFATAELAPRAAAILGGTESDHRGLLFEFDWLGRQDATERGLWHDRWRRRQLARIITRDFSPDEPDRMRRAAWLSAATGFDELVRGQGLVPPLRSSML